MRSVVRLAMLASILAGAHAEDALPPRFSSGLVHSGTLEIELDVQGAKNLTILAEPENQRERPRVTWVKTAFLDSKKKPLPARRSKKSADDRLDFRFEDERVASLRLVVRVEGRGEALTTIRIHHDAPTSDAAGSRANARAAKLRGNPSRGRSVFFGRGTCASCHVIDGRGGEVGPDLSSLGKRSSPAQIIESLTSPDAAIASGFETNIVEGKDGTLHLGFVAGDDKEQITLRDTAGQSHVIKKADVVARKPQAFSLMPPFGELLSPQQLADLAAFLHARRD